MQVILPRTAAIAIAMCRWAISKSIWSALAALWWRLALSFRPDEGLAEVQEPGCAGGQA
jgi:hypothetical protein